jgi:hypothetical protein
MHGQDGAGSGTVTIFSGHDVTILGLLFILGAKEVEVDPHTLNPDTFLDHNNVKGNRPSFYWPYYGGMHSAFAINHC